ncbi:PDGLE domain-containing protein [Haloarcula sp. 1CSR25-25]|uniref:PDGLE domain-containing protein n=1 Tax=Haloarcula sp. 1CSR25-25 TaxID=2862545 RepID=UPI00289482E8|nr:PDGLE domain-containing protein [Haloarcula sp. 1CSR25-25]MDT3433651.1 PDGLE domain-containing protein [Haloarcula sp. 1CSR25-25]
MARERPDWLPRALAALLVLTLLAPVFGWAAGQVGYAEPLAIAAEATGATDHATAAGTALFPDYGVTGLGGATGTFVSAVVGTALTLLLGAAIGRVLGSDTDRRQ